MKKENDFGRDSIPLLVLKISIPFMFAQFVNVLYSIVDRIYICLLYTSDAADE